MTSPASLIALRRQLMERDFARMNDKQREAVFRCTVHDIYGMRTGSRTGFIEIKTRLNEVLCKIFRIFANKLS